LRRWASAAAPAGRGRSAYLRHRIGQPVDSRSYSQERVGAGGLDGFRKVVCTGDRGTDVLLGRAGVMVWCVHVERVSTTRTPVRFAVRSNHGHRPPQTGPGRVTTAQLAGTAGRYVSRKPLDVEAAVAELREIANGRGDLLAERAGLTLGFYARDNRNESARRPSWPRYSSLQAPA
jgi:hypothetical protein